MHSKISCLCGVNERKEGIILMFLHLKQLMAIILLILSVCEEIVARLEVLSMSFNSYIT